MSVELTMLAWSGLLTLAVTLVQGTRNVLVLGLPTAAGNLHNIPAWEGWHDRLNRSLRNLIEAMIIFAPVVVAAHLSGKANETSALGAQLFFFSRLVHAPVYTIGIPYLRTFAWFGGVVGIIMVGSVFF